MSSLFDPYDRRARLYPMVLTLLPLALAAAVWVPPEAKIEGAFGSVLVLLAVSSLLAQVARDQGKAREPALFEAWGGRPSDRAISYAGGMFAADTVRRRHGVLRQCDPSLTFPASDEEERANPDRFKGAFAASTEYLLGRTRDRSQFGLLFQENMNYGYRRNLWGMKPAGIALAVIGLVACIANIVYAVLHDAAIPWVPVVGATGCIALVVFWIFRIKASWVRLAADAYARQLAESCDRLAANG